MAVRIDSKARAKFKGWLSAHKISHHEIAELLGVPVGRIKLWNNGSMTPTYADREAIHRLMKIPLLDWLTDGELVDRKATFERLDRLAKTKPKAPDFFEKIAARL